MHTVLDIRISDLEQFLAEVRHWDLDFRVMDTGGFTGHVKQLTSPEVLITYARFRSGLDQSGSAPPGFRTFAIPGKSCNGFWWRGHQVTRDDVMVFPLSNELHSATRQDFEVVTVSIAMAYLEQLVDDFCLDGFLQDARQLIRLSRPSADGLRRLAGSILRSKDDVITQAAAHNLAEKLVIYAAQARPEKRASLRQRDLAIERVVEYLRSHRAPTSELAHLCRIARVSERTLQYAFKERYGIAPNVFVKNWKLNSARRLLLRADPSATTISDIAYRFGFVHQGQFAADYRRLFAEPPSRTLRTQH